jgi:hypothetical protein
MTLLLIVPAWILLIALVTGLCRAARLGDDAGQAEWLRVQPESQTHPAASPPRPTAPSAGQGGGRAESSPAHADAPPAPVRADIAA